jgi:hypothetical protein
MKWEQLPIIDRTGEGLLHRPAFVVGLIVFEVAVAGWLAFGVCSRKVAWFPSACFGVFALVALYQALTGAESCGCFGRIKVNPWLTFWLGLTLAGALWVWWPGGGKRSEDRGWRVEDGGQGSEDRGSRIEDRQERKMPGLAYRLVGVGGVVLLALGLSLWRLPPARAAGDMPGMVRAGSMTILEPKNGSPDRCR